MKKKFLPFLATSIITAAAILPFGAGAAQAANYNPTYTCYYRDTSGSCMSYQTSEPYISPNTAYTSTNLYGNRATYPFNTLFNAQSVTPSAWDNRYSNRYNSGYNTFHYGGIDATDYIDYYDDEYYRNGQWQYYYDQKDNTVRPYRFQATNYYNNGYYNNAYNSGNTHYEYESTKISCTGRNCASYK